MLKKLTKLSLLSLMSISLLATNVSKVEAVDVEGSVILNALSKNIVKSVNTFYEGREGKVKPTKRVEVEGSYDESDVPLRLELEEDTDEAAEYSFTFPAQVSSIITDLFAKDFGKKRRLRANLKSVNSIVGSFVGEVTNEVDNKKKKSGSVGSVNSVDSVGSVTNVSSELKFLTSGVRAIRTKKNPDVITLRGRMNKVQGPRGRLAKGRFSIKFSQ